MTRLELRRLLWRVERGRETDLRLRRVMSAAIDALVAGGFRLPLPEASWKRVSQSQQSAFDTELASAQRCYDAGRMSEAIEHYDKAFRSFGSMRELAETIERRGTEGSRLDDLLLALGLQNAGGLTTLEVPVRLLECVDEHLDCGRVAKARGVLAVCGLELDRLLLKGVPGSKKPIPVVNVGSRSDEQGLSSLEKKGQGVVDRALRMNRVHLAERVASELGVHERVRKTEDGTSRRCMLDELVALAKRAASVGADLERRLESSRPGT